MFDLSYPVEINATLYILTYYPVVTILSVNYVTSFQFICLCYFPFTPLSLHLLSVIACIFPSFVLSFISFSSFLSAYVLQSIACIHHCHIDKTSAHIYGREECCKHSHATEMSSRRKGPSFILLGKIRAEEMYVNLT